MKAAFTFLALCAVMGLLSISCSDRLAGGSDDVENPGIRVSLSDPEGRPTAGGTVSLYARYQNPFKDSLPILSVEVSGDSAMVKDTAVESAFQRAQTRGIPVPARDTLEFNLIASSTAGESFQGGFALVRVFGAWSVLRRSGGTIAYPDPNGLLASNARLAAPAVGQGGQIGSRGLELGLKRVFVPGSPYRSEVAADGSFAFAPMAVGRYELKAISADDKVYTAADSLSTGTPYSASDWSEAEIIWVSP
jgi:hypothetical protein